MKRAYPSVTFRFNAEEQRIGNVVDRVDALLRRKEQGKLEKWRPIQQIVADINAGKDNVPAKLYEAASAVLARVNSIFADEPQ